MIIITVLMIFIFPLQIFANISMDRLDFPQLQLRDPSIKGESVWMLEAKLKELGYENSPNGYYDKETYNTVRLFQAANAYEEDGIVNEAIWKAVFDYDSEFCLGRNEENKIVSIVIDVSQRSLSLYEDGQLIKEYAVGVGKSKTPSPLGEWKVINKSVGWGGGFGSRWMGLNVPWGIYGVHGTNKPHSIGGAESHGCIRMRNSDVEDLYPRVPHGTVIKIVEDGKLFPGNFKPKVLQKKNSGQSVVYVQSVLKEKGIIFDQADGRFGNMTELAVKYYQAWHGLEITGIVDEEMYYSLGMIEKNKGSKRE